MSRFERGLQEAAEKMPPTVHETRMPCVCPCGQLVAMTVRVESDGEAFLGADHPDPICLVFAGLLKHIDVEPTNRQPWSEYLVSLRRARQS